MMQLGQGEGLPLRDEQFKDWLDDDAQGAEPRGRPEVPGGAEAGRHDASTTCARTSSGSSSISQVQRDEVGSKLTITEEEARQYYQAHQQEFTEPANRDAARDPDRSADDHPEGSGRRSTSGRTTRRAKRATAMRGGSWRARISRKVAAEVSAAPSKANGGLIGPINVSELSRAAAEAARRR